MTVSSADENSSLAADPKKLAVAEVAAGDAFDGRHIEPVGLLNDGTEVFIPFPVFSDSDEDDNCESHLISVDGKATSPRACAADEHTEPTGRHIEPVGFLDDGTEVFIPFPVLDDSDDDDEDGEPSGIARTAAPSTVEDANASCSIMDASQERCVCQSDEVAGPEDKSSTEIKEFISMEENGYAILHSALTSEQVQVMRRLLAADLQQAIEQETLPAGDPAGSFAKIHNRECRHDLRLKLEDHVRSALRHCVTSHRAVYESLLDTTAPLVELGVITSHPGAQSQIIHADVDFCGTARKIYTTFVALQDIDESMGPTEIWPGTHTAYFCEFYKPRMLGPVDPYYEENPPERMTLKAGDAVLMDTRVMHRGGENRSNADRMLFHFSWETSVEEDAPQGFTYNMRSELRGKHCLKEFVT